jgi:hypothetical protein
MRNPEKCQNHREALRFFLVNLKITFTFIKLASELYHNQFSIYFLYKGHQNFVNVIIFKY